MATSLRNISATFIAKIKAAVGVSVTVAEWNGDEAAFPTMNGIYVEMFSGDIQENIELGNDSPLSVKEPDVIVHYVGTNANFFSWFDLVCPALNDKTFAVTGWQIDGQIKPTNDMFRGRNWTTVGVQSGTSWRQQSWKVVGV